jgi:hypothetical protein
MISPYTDADHNHLSRMESPPLPATVRTLDIEGQPVRCIEEAGGKRVWLCDCPKFKERATRHPEGFCAHTAVAIMRCVQDESIEIR